VKPKKIPPALILLVTAPVFGELFSASSPFNEFINPVTFITLALLYGCGAIIVRELLVRWRKGWLSLLLLGCAYGIYEEGLLVQSFFDPTWQDLGSLAVYGRVWGVNWVWSEHLTIFHAVISIAASITFVEILYPERRGQSWVSSRFWWIANWVGFLGVYAIWEILTSYNPGMWKAVTVLSILLLALAARAAPVGRISAPTRSTPRPFWFWCVGFVGAFGHFFLVYLGADGGKYPFPTAMLLLAAFDLLILWVALRWSRGATTWDDRLRLALINGALTLLLVMTMLTAGDRYPILYVTHPLYILLLAWAAYRVGRRVKAEVHG
jgi:hypothetical protein